jgi:hypothetical protein
MSITKPESFVTPKQLGDALEALGVIPYRYKGCRRLIKAMRLGGYQVIRGNSVRATDAQAFLMNNPDWRAFSKAKAHEQKA